MSEAQQILDEIKCELGFEETPAVFQVAARNDAYLRTLWERYRAVMQPGEIDRKTKELMGLAVATVKSNEYMVEFQKERLAASEVSEEEQLEALAVADFFDGFDAFAHALRVDSEIRPRRLLAGDVSLIDREVDVNVSYVKETEDPLVREVYSDIRSVMGIPFVPNIFKALAHQPGALKAKWESYKAILCEGRLSRLTKELIAVAVSAVNACFY